MAPRKKTESQHKHGPVSPNAVIVNAGVMVEQPITETLEKNYMPYAMSVILSRAIPEIDGFKPSHRKLLYTMYKMGLLTAARTKSANVVGQTREAAEDRLADLGFTFRTVGDGDTVTDQTPAGGAIVPGNASIILYLGQEKPDTPCTVPNVVGKSASEANKAITNAGLIMKVTGTTTASSGNVYAITQSLPAGTEVAAGTVVTVQFGDNSVLD